MRKILVFSLLLLIHCIMVRSQVNPFVENFRVGFGAGINFSHIMESESYNLYEDLTGAEYRNAYSGIFQNFGHQYFVQLDYRMMDFLALTLKPGTYTYAFSRLTNIMFENDTVEQSNQIRLRYFELPLEVRYTLDLGGTFMPYVGGGFTYARLMDSQETANRTFIRPRMTLGGVAGTYINLNFLILDFNVGYHYGLHVITSRDNRDDTSSRDSYAQSDIRLNDLKINLSVLFSLQANKKGRGRRSKCKYPQ
jgi:opacity protein-like surface antigen